MTQAQKILNQLINLGATNVETSHHFYDKVSLCSVDVTISKSQEDLTHITIWDSEKLQINIWSKFFINGEFQYRHACEIFQQCYLYAVNNKFGETK